MDKQRLYIYWKIVGVPLSAFVALAIFYSLVFQHFYLRPVVLESETLKSLTGAIFGMAVFGSFAAALWMILYRHRVLLGRTISTLMKTMVVILIVLSVLGFIMDLAVALVMLIRVVGT